MLLSEFSIIMRDVSTYKSNLIKLSYYQNYSNGKILVKTYTYKKHTHKQIQIDQVHHPPKRN